MSGLISAAFGLLLKVAGQPLIDRSKRQERVIAALKKVKLDGPIPRDFDGIYARALIERCYGAPNPVLNFFRDEYIRQAFILSYHGADWSDFYREVEVAIERNEETGEFGAIDYNIRNELAGFKETFDKLVSESRAPSEARIEGKVDALPQTIIDALHGLSPAIAADLARVVATQSGEEVYRKERQPERATASPAELLAADIEAWFITLGYIIEQKPAADRDSFAWLVRAPTQPGRYGRTVVYGVAGELELEDVAVARRWVDELGAEAGWAVARQRVSAAATTAAGKDGKILCYTFDELIDLGVDFEPYINWLEREVIERQIEGRYVELSCRKSEPEQESAKTPLASRYDWRDGGLSEYVQRWLADPATEHLSILGEFGTGKTWFSLRFAWEAAKLWREAKRRGLPRPRLPLVIPLRHYTKAASVRTVISQFFFDDHRIRIDYTIFQHLNQMGRLLLVFDGFDEMAVRVDRDTMVRNFWELAKVVEPNAKVLLSCRSEHFPSDREGRELLSGGVKASVTDLPQDAPKFDVIDIEPLDDDQVQLMLRGRSASDETIEQVMGDAELNELMRRPIMSDLVLEALPEIRAGEPIDMARVFLYAVRRKLDRDIHQERTFTSRTDKLFFLCELSWEMLASNQLSMNYRAFPERIRAYFGETVRAEKDLDYWRHDMQSQSLLIRNSEGDYTPAHKSLLEFFVAIKFAAELGMLEGEFLAAIQDSTSLHEGRKYRWSEYFLQNRIAGKLPPVTGFLLESPDRLVAGFGANIPNHAVIQFLEAITRTNEDRLTLLLDVARSTSGMTSESAAMLGASAISLAAYIGAEFEGTSLTGVKLNSLNRSIETYVQSLKGADLRQADLRGSDLAGVDLRNCDLTGALLDNPTLLLQRPVAIAVYVARDGAIVAHTRTDLRLWHTGTLQASPVKIQMPTHRSTFYNTSIGEVSGGVIAASLEGVHLVASSTGRVLKTIDGEWVLPIERDSEPAMLVGLPNDQTDLYGMTQLQMLTGDGGRVIAESSARGAGPFDIDWSPDVGLYRVESDSKRSGVSIYVADENLTWTRASSLDSTNIRFRYAACGVIWTARNDDELLEIWHPTGHILWGVESLGGALYQPPLRMIYLPDRSWIIFANDNAVEAWSLPDREFVWSHRLTAPGSTLAVDHVRDSFVLGTESGEISRRLLVTGEVVDRTSISEKLIGARLSRSCGLDEQVLVDFVGAGGVLAD